MALTVIWSPKATEAFDEIVEYLHTHWTEREVKIFVQKSNAIIKLIVQNPAMYQASEKRKHQHKALILPPVSLVYRHKPRKQVVELVIFWANRKDLKNLNH